MTRIEKGNKVHQKEEKLVTDKLHREILYVLKEHTEEAIKDYYESVVRWYLQQRTEEANIGYSETAQNRRLPVRRKDFNNAQREDALQSLKSSREPQFAGLLMSYVRQMTNGSSFCPLCQLKSENESIRGLDGRCLCKRVCIAGSWCTVYTLDDNSFDYKRAAYNLVVKECKKRGCTNLAWLKRWR